MAITKPATLTARLSLRVRTQAERAAHMRGTTLSRFAAIAIEDAALREMVSAATEPEPGTTVAPKLTEAT
jgi:uncharacterized protein (DUF1778 family)